MTVLQPVTEHQVSLLSGLQWHSLKQRRLNIGRGTPCTHLREASPRSVNFLSYPCKTKNKVLQSFLWSTNKNCWQMLTVRLTTRQPASSTLRLSWPGCELPAGSSFPEPAWGGHGLSQTKPVLSTCSCPFCDFFFSETPLGISCKQVLCQALRVEFLTTLWSFPSENILVIFERASLNCWIENYCKWVLHFCISLVSWKEVALLTNQKQAIMWIHLLWVPGGTAGKQLGLWLRVASSVTAFPKLTQSWDLRSQ